MTKLTGRTRFRALTGTVMGLVWQVETIQHVLSPSGQMVSAVYDWRDGQVEDLCEINSIVYSTINVKVELPVHEELPGEEKQRGARKLH